jgi:hypothetical protein
MSVSPIQGRGKPVHTSFHPQPACMRHALSLDHAAHWGGVPLHFPLASDQAQLLAAQADAGSVAQALGEPPHAPVGAQPGICAHWAGHSAAHGLATPTH